MVKEIAPQCDVVLVVGSRNSSNSVRLAEVALDAGAQAAYLVDYAHEIHDEWLAGATTVGLTSGASVPDELVMQVLDHLAERGFAEVAEVTTAQEKLTFSLPQELKRDMRGRRGGQGRRGRQARCHGRVGTDRNAAIYYGPYQENLGRDFDGVSGRRGHAAPVRGAH